MLVFPVLCARGAQYGEIIWHLSGQVKDNATFSLLPFVLMAETPAFLTSSLFLDIERSTKILYDIKKLELSAVLFVYIDKEQLYKLEFLGVRSQG